MTTETLQHQDENSPMKIGIEGAKINPPVEIEAAPCTRVMPPHTTHMGHLVVIREARWRACLEAIRGRVC